MKRLLAVLSVLVVIASIVAISASAANTTDRTIYQAWSPSGTSAPYTPLNHCQVKEDTSCVYLCLAQQDSDTSHIAVRTMGCNANNGGRHNETIALGQDAEYVICRLGVAYSIHNEIKEVGYAYASLDFYPVGSPTPMISGVWSPDSAYTHVEAYSLR